MDIVVYRKIVKSWILLPILAMISCQSMKLDKTAPVAIEKVYFDESVTGTSLVIHLKEAAEIKLDSAYFRGKRTKLRLPDTIRTYIGYFNKLPKDLIMDSDPQKEFGNQINTSETTKFPFTLKDDECVISYSKEQETRYFKLQGLKKSP